jgi:hypothetical protein
MRASCLILRKEFVHTVQKARWPSGPVWKGMENLASSGFDPQKVQPIASSYTDYANLATICHAANQIIFRICCYAADKSTLQICVFILCSWFNEAVSF